MCLTITHCHHRSLGMQYLINGKTIPSLRAARFETTHKAQGCRDIRKADISPGVQGTAGEDHIRSKTGVPGPWIPPLRWAPDSSLRGTHSWINQWSLAYVSPRYAMYRATYDEHHRPFCREFQSRNRIFPISVYPSATRGTGDMTWMGLRNSRPGCWAPPF